MYAIKDHIVVVRAATMPEALDQLNRYLTGRWPDVQIVNLETGKVVATASLRKDITIHEEEVKKDESKEASASLRGESDGADHYEG